MSMSEAKKRANKKWNDANMKERYDRVQLVLPKGRKSELQAAADRKKESVNKFINRLISEELERLGMGEPPEDGAVEVDPQQPEEEAAPVDGPETWGPHTSMSDIARYYKEHPEELARMRQEEYEKSKRRRG